MKRAIITHGWEGRPERAWYQWLGNELKEKGFEIEVPFIPCSDNPTIEEWTGFLEDLIRVPDPDTYLIFHSLGCQGGMRYLTLPYIPENAHANRTILVAPFFELLPNRTEDPKYGPIIKPWLETPIDYDKVKKHAGDITAIFSDTDPIVPTSNIGLIRERLDPKEIILLNKAGHMGESAGYKEFPLLLEKVLYG